MARYSDTSGQADAPTSGICQACGGEAHADWRFCPRCGRPVGTPAATAEADTVAPNVPDFIPLSGVDLTQPTRRRRRRRPFYRRPKAIIPLVLLLAIVGVAGFAFFRANTVMTSLRTISTPPPQITDSTWIDEDDSAPEGGPITADTGPALQALEEAGDRDLPQEAEGGIGGRIRGATGNFGDVVRAASASTGSDAADPEGFTLLLMGVDARPGAAIDIGVRPDVLMLIRFDAEQRTCRMLSIPRDTRVELPGYGESKINHALMVGGIPYQLMVTEDFVGQPIDHYLLIDFVAFQQVVEAIGGVEVRIPEDLEAQGEVQYRAGDHAFDGEEALAYARFRTFSDDGDLSRVERQWSIMAAMARAADDRNLIDDVTTLVPTIEDHLRTDLTLTEMATMARHYGQGCLDADRDAVAKIDGSRVQLTDPILDQADYYNVVTDATVEQRVEDLLGEAPPADGASTNAGTVAAGTVAIDGERRSRSTRNARQGATDRRPISPSVPPGRRQ